MRHALVTLCATLLTACAGIGGTGAGKSLPGYDRPVNIIDNRALHRMDRTLLRDPALVDYVQGIRGRLEQAHGEPCDCVVMVDSFGGYEAYTISPKTIVLSAGLIAQAESEDELAAVIAHELSHVYAWDSVKGMFQEAAVFAVKAGAWAAGEGGYAVMLDDYIDDASKGLIYRQWNAEQEVEADRYAVRTLARAGYSIDGLKMAIRRISDYSAMAAPPPARTNGCAELVTRIDDNTLKGCSKQLTGSGKSVYMSQRDRLEAVLSASKALEPEQRHRRPGAAPPKSPAVAYLFGLNALVSDKPASLKRALSSIERQPLPAALQGNVAVTNRLAMAHRVLGNSTQADRYMQTSFASPDRTTWTFFELFRHLNEHGRPEQIMQAISAAHEEIGLSQVLLPVEAYLAKRHKLIGIELIATVRCGASVVGDLRTYNLCSEFQKHAERSGRAPW
jgi:putative metalloprotease